MYLKFESKFVLITFTPIEYKRTMILKSKLPNVGTNIFSVMSALAKEHNAINLSQGFPNFDCPTRLKSLVAYYMKEGYNQYAPMQGVPELTKSISNKIKNFYDADIDPTKEITITAGATQAIYCAITALVHPNDEVIVIEPAYDCYKPAIELCGAYAIPYSLKGPDYKIDWNKFHHLFSRNTRMIIINNPHNPIGKVLSEEDLLQLQKITQGTNIYILSDEVYEHLIYDDAKHQSVLKFPELYNRSVCTFSFGKTFHNTGWKMGYFVAPPAITEEIRKVHQFNVFSVNTPMQHAIAEFSENLDFFEDLPNFYKSKRDFFLSEMEKSRFIPIECNGTYFQLFDYSQISELPDTEFAKWLLKEHKIATIPVSPFRSKSVDEKVVRVCFAKTEEILKKAANKLCRV